MAVISLADLVQDNPEAQALLNGPDSSSHVAFRLHKEFGIETSRHSVDRWRQKRVNDSDPYTRTTVVVPKGWEPYSEWSGMIGEAIVRLPVPGATEKDLLISAGFDPDCWRISGNVNTRKWMRYDQEWLYYYKFDVEQGESPESVQAHVGELVREIRKRRVPPPKFYSLDHDRTFVIVLADWQIGKAEQGRGSADTVARWTDCLSQAKEEIVRLRKGGVVIDKLAILSVGDLVEGCGDHYDMQTFLVDLDRRSQNRVVREMLTKTILLLSPMFAHTTIACIGGNHGENRRKGKAYTTFADNDDVATVEAVKESFDLAGWPIEWYIPDEELSQVVYLSDVPVGLVHGHQFKGGVNVLKKSEDWWRGQDFGFEVVRDAQILVSGHFHFNIEANITYNRTWMQSPTIDPGSKWYTDATGNSSIPGVLTFVVDPSHPLGYDYKRILHPHDTVQVS